MRSLIAALLLFVLPSAVHAQTREEGRRAMEEGQRQWDAGNYQLSLEAFERAYHISSSIPEIAHRAVLLLWNIGRAQEQLGRFDAALHSYERFLNGAPADAPFRQEALDRSRNLRARLAAESSAPPLMPIGIAIAAVGAASLIASIPTGVLALDGEAQLTSMCPSGDCPPSAQGLIDSTQGLVTATDVLWVAGAILAAGGATVLILGLTMNPPATAAAACTEDGCVATIRASF
jgi:tetratricopeptide (TPR) repeat protein